MFDSINKITKYLSQYTTLPGGALLYQFTTDGNIYVTGNGQIEEITKDNETFRDKLHLFINQGNEAYYLLGNPKTSDKNPQNATVKLGLTEHHHSFTPHAHGARHFVKSEGFSGCILYDKESKKAVVIKLVPGSMIDIPPMVPHAFYNRSDVPLITLVVNTGLGLEHEDYAITKKEAERRLAHLADIKNKQELEELVLALEEVETMFKSQHPEHDMSLNEKMSKQLYKIAEHLSMQA